MDANEAISQVMAVEGQISPAESLLLFQLASKVSEGVILEVGSYRGRSTVALALGTRAGASLPVFAIEPHEPFQGALGGVFGPEDREHFFRNLLRAGVVQQVRLVNLSSELVAGRWGRPISLLWLDGDHTLEGVTRDYRCWEEHVPLGGVIVFHDSTDPTLGPRHLVSDLLKYGRYRQLGIVDNTTVLQKAA